MVRRNGRPRLLLWAGALGVTDRGRWAIFESRRSTPLRTVATLISARDNLLEHIGPRDNYAPVQPVLS